MKLWIALLLLMPSQALARDFWYAASDHSGELIFYLDESTLVVGSQNTITGWMTGIYEGIKRAKGVAYYKEKTQWNCADRTETDLYVATYSGNGDNVESEAMY